MSIAFDGLVVFATDMKAATRFYQDGLGLVQDWADGDHIQFHLPTRGNPQGGWLLLHPATPGSSSAHLGTFTVDDVDATVGRLRDAGYPISQEPQNEPWGVREATVADPDGNGLTLATPLAADSSGQTV
jgi:catechol 2,3-dioxygenase-like lactoylglutathione lyase family enzyme